MGLKEFFLGTKKPGYSETQLKATPAQRKMLFRYREKENRNAALQAYKSKSQPAGINRFAQSVIKARVTGLRYGQAIRRPIIGSGIKKSGRGRPVGTVKHSIPGVGPVGVYEYRKWFSAKLRMERLQAEQQYMQRRQAVGQQFQPQPQQYPGEQNTIPSTSGVVPLKSLHQEAEDYSHLFD